MTSSAVQVNLPSVVDDDPAQLWFGPDNYVLRGDGGVYSVFVGGVLIGSYSKDDPLTRDVLIVIALNHLEVGGQVSWADIACAFRVGRATVGRAMQRYKQGGIIAVATPRRIGRKSKRTPQLRRRLYGLFDKGLGVRAAHRVVAKRVGYSVVQRLHKEWESEREKAASEHAPHPRLLASEQERANDNAEVPATPATPPITRPDIDIAIAQAALTDVGNEEVASDKSSEEKREDEAVAAAAPADEAASADEERIASHQDPLQPAEPSLQAQRQREQTPEELLGSKEGVLVQHVGTWLFLTLLLTTGVYGEACKWCGNVSRLTLRVVLDVVAMALALGERCIEGVRRLETPSGFVLLRHKAMVSPNWARRVLKAFSMEKAVMFRANITASLLRRSSERREQLWLYVDNHGRRYTGKHKIRKTWRMQDKRAVPGTPDYYVHDGDGYPIYRVTASNHSSLSDWLPRILTFVRQVLGDEPEIVLSFDRAGSNATCMSELKKLGGAFVTYERKPYPLLSKTAFTERMELVLPSRPRKPTVLHYTEPHAKNLRRGRGRVRRIALLMEDGKQVNLVTSSELPAEVLIRGHLARWGNQENQFKHSAERWGINQLDRRGVEPYPPDAIIPNPDRRALDRKLALARAAEGKARCDLATVQGESPKAERLREEVESAVKRQQDLRALRRNAPTHAPVHDTSVASDLKRHETEYKDVVDTLRIVFAYLEGELARDLAQHLQRPREAKKVLANLLSAPGYVRLGKRTWTVELMPAGTPNELHAFRELLRSINARNLHLPGDPTKRPVKFSVREAQ